MQLVGRDDAPYGAQQEAGLEPFVQRNMAALEHRADRRTKLFATAATELQSGSRTLSGNSTDPIGGATTCTYRSVWPYDFFELRMSRLLVPEIGPRNDRHYCASPKHGWVPKQSNRLGLTN